MPAAGRPGGRCHVPGSDFSIASELWEDHRLRSILKAREPVPVLTTFSDVFTLAAQAARRLRLGAEAVRVATLPNAGGKSVVSEALSMEYMVRRFGATDVITEMEIEYWNPNWKKVDYITSLYGMPVGVSVTRAMAFAEPFTEEDGMRLLKKKLYGLIIARCGITEAQRFDKSILHVWCQSEHIANVMQSVWVRLSAGDETVRHEVVVLLTVARAADDIFTDNRTLLEPYMAAEAD